LGLVNRNEFIAGIIMIPHPRNFDQKGQRCGSVCVIRNGLRNVRKNRAYTVYLIGGLLVAFSIIFLLIVSTTIV